MSYKGKQEDYGTDSSFVACNEDIQAVGSPSITFLRQLVAVCAYPALLKDPSINTDIKARAERILQSCDGESLGSYNSNLGIQAIREDVVNYVTQRDQLPMCIDDVSVSSDNYEMTGFFLHLMTTSKQGQCRAGVLLPNPGPAILSTILAVEDITPIYYDLDDENDWAINVSVIRKVLSEAKSYCTPRAWLVYSPGNPTGNVLSRDVIEEIISLCADLGLALIVDESSQMSIFDATVKFVSFRKVLLEIKKFRDQVQLVSMASPSGLKGGDAGFRSGFCEYANVDMDLKVHVFRMFHPQATSQVFLSGLLNPPRENEPSYALYKKEAGDLVRSYRRRIQKAMFELQKVEGIDIKPPQSGIFLILRVHIPTELLYEANKKGLAAYALYLQQLDMKTGIKVTSAFRHEHTSGTHFSCVISLAFDDSTLMRLINDFKRFHKSLSQS